MTYHYLIDANINRAKEGARVLEDVARFVLHDKMLFEQARAIRHALRPKAPVRAPHKDPGGHTFKEDNVRKNVIALIHANALRVQEALRVLEETSDNQANKQSMKALRYAAYALHQAMHDRAMHTASPCWQSLQHC